MQTHREEDRLCQCTKCCAQDPGGLWISANTHRVHQRKRREPDSEDFNWATSTNLNTVLQPNTTGSSSAVTNTINLSSQGDPLIAARLDLQDLRLQVVAWSQSIRRPLRLDFVRHRKPPRPGAPYTYQGVFNQPPYDLVHSPTNTSFLEIEEELHRWAERLHRLCSSLAESNIDYNYQLQVQSVHNTIVSRINQMYAWKVELHPSSSNPRASVKSCTVVDTARYLQRYQERGDPRYSQFVLSGLLLVLVLHLCFNTSQAVCDLILAFLHDQAELLSGLITEELSQQLSSAIPRSVKTVLSIFDLDPCVHRYWVCPQCYALSREQEKQPANSVNREKGKQREIDPTPNANEAVDPAASKPTATQPSTRDADGQPAVCTFRGTPASPLCNAKLTRSRALPDGNEVNRPIMEYLHQDIYEWVGRKLCDPDFMRSLRRGKDQFGERHANTIRGDPLQMRDIMESPGIVEFPWPDGKPWFDCGDEEFRLFFALTADGFNPLHNLEAKQTASSTAIYLFCLNLPLDERQKPENIFLAGVIPGPDKPSTSQINHYTSLIVEAFLPFWNAGVRYTQTSDSPHGVLIRAGVAPVVCDALGARQICGYGSVTSQFFCTFCWLPLWKIENFHKASWPQRDLDSHRYWAERWRDANDDAEREDIFEAHGIRYTPLLELPYFNPIEFTIVDTMHNFFLGLLQRHCRAIWGMDITLEDGDGKERVRKKALTPPSAEKMRAVRKALELKDVALLTKSGKHVLFYLCLELDLRRGGKKKDHIRELLRWRESQGAFLPQSWGEKNTQLESEIEAARTYIPEDGARTPTAATQNAAAQRASVILSAFSLPAELTAEQIEYAESLIARGLKLTSIRRDVLAYMCRRRELPVPDRAVKATLISILEQWRTDNPQTVTPKKKKHVMSAVLGKSILTEVSKDMERTVVPRWVDPAPARVGHKKQGKLSADQWRSFCSIHLVITLVRLWGVEPEASRWFEMLSNFLDLVRGVEIGSMLATFPEQVSTYSTVMTRYLVKMKELYKEAAVVPNHHLALHVPDFMQIWGPSPQARGFGWERQNHTLQQVNTNKRFGDIEKSYMLNAARSANLLLLLSTSRMREAVSSMYAKLQLILNGDVRGTRLHDMFQRSSATPSKPKLGKEITLSNVALESLTQLVNSRQDIAYVPAHRAPPVTAPTPANWIHIMHPTATSLSSLKHEGAVYRPFNRSMGDCNVLLRQGSACGLPYRPARLERIFVHERVVGTGVVEEVFCVVRHLKPLALDQVQRDPYRKFPIAGSLWSRSYEDEAQLQVIQPALLLCHFARTAMEPSDVDVGIPTFHVLPLDRLKTYVEDGGTPVVDSFFDGLDGVNVEEDDEDSEDEMDVDME